MFELRDKIRELDFATDMKFDLLGLYEMSELTDAEKKLMATIIHTAENEEKAAEEVFEILNAPNAVNMDEDCEPEREFKEVFHPAYEELQNGDEIIVNGQHLYVADAEYADDYVWVTDEKEDRYNKRAPGNTLAKYMIDDVIGQPDDDDDEELDESLKDFMFTVKCNDGPKELIKVVAEDKAKAEEYAKKMYAQNHTTYADDRHNIWSIDEDLSSDIDKVKHAVDQFKGQVTVSKDSGNDVREYLLSKNISFMIDDSKSAKGKLTFMLKYPIPKLLNKNENLSGNMTVADIAKKHNVDYVNASNISSAIDSLNSAVKIPNRLNMNINESVIRYPNGMEVTDVDLDRALDYQYGTDRNMDNSKYTDEEKQRAVTYWINKTNPNPYNESKVSEEDTQYGVHSFSQSSIIFRGTEEECAEFIADHNLWDDAEIYAMTPDDPHYLKEAEEDGLEDATQEYTSANTSINSAKLPAIFSMVNFKPETINLDYGGGKFDNATAALEGKGVTNLIYDPYNRSSGHNKDVIDTVRKNGGADTVTCSNVLNVIKEPEARKAVIKNIYSLLKNSGTAYFTVYEGTGKGNEGPTRSGYQLNKKTGDYVEEISSVFPSVSRRGKLIIASKGTSITEEFDDDWSDTLETGGEPTYCPDCGVKFVRDEEGDAICPKCNKTPYQLANERRKNESLNKNELEELFKLCHQLGIHTLGDLELFMKNEGKGKAILSALKDYLFFEIGDPDFQAKDESLKESDDSQFDKAVEAMKAYWNYQMSLEQLHNTLLKIYNNDAEKAFKVFVEYGDAARRTKDECLNCDPKEENVSTVKEEVLKEDTDAEEWEEVATKTVEDSDGFLTDYVWYTDGDKHVFIFGDSDIYRPEDGYFDWEIDIVEGKEAEAYKEAQDWFNSYNGFAEELDEAQDIYDIQGQAVRDARRKEVLDEFKEIFTDEPGGINLDNEETLAIVRGYLEDMGYVVEVSETQNASHPIHIEWFK